MDFTPSADGNDQRPVTLGIVTSARLADILNNKTANNATTGNNDVNLRVASNVITAAVFIGDELVSIPFSFYYYPLYSEYRRNLPIAIF